MIFRFFLQHESFGIWPISEPMGWDSAKLKLTRDPEFHSLVEEFDIEATFYGDNGTQNGGVEIIKQVERIYGVDTELRLVTEMSFDDGITYPLSFTGLLSLDEAEENPNNQITIPVIPDDLWTKFFNRKDTSVNLQSTTDLDDAACSAAVDVNLNLSSQIVPKAYEGILNDSFVVFEADWDPNDYIQLTMDEDVLDEINDVFNLPIATNPEIPVPILEPVENGDYTFDLRIECSIIYYQASGTPPNCVSNRFITVTSGILDFYIQKNDETPIAFTITDSPLILTDRSTTYSYNATLSLVKGDQIRVYGDITNAMTNGDSANFFIWSINNAAVVRNIVIDATTCGPIGFLEQNIDLGVAPSTEGTPTYFRIDAQTVFPETVSEGFLLHDTFSAIIRRITGQDAFYSEVLGSPLTTERSYADEGCYWNYGLVKGLQLRQYNLVEKPFFQSFNQAWNGANPIFNLGLGLDVLQDGQEVFRIEEKAHFYDQSSTSIDLNFVRDIVRSYDKDVIFNKITVGYKKWQSDDISGIDDAQTKHEYAPRAKMVGRPIDLQSDFIAASLAIETTRRTTREKSADYKYDNDTFIIAIREPDVSPDLNGYVPELDENFASIGNLQNPETRYNHILTPLRNFFRWANLLTAWLQDQYLSDPIKFVSGEGNYDMTSDYNCAVGRECVAVICDPVSEKQDISLTSYYIPFGKLHSHYQYDINIDLSYEQYLAIRNNRELAIGISQTDLNHVKFFIKTLEYEIKTGNAKISAWAVEYMDLQIIEQEFTMRCTPSEEECEDAITDEFAEQLTDEFGRCITA